MRVATFFQLKLIRSPGRRPGSTRTAACLALAVFSLVGCEAQEAEPDAGSPPHFDAAPDADPRSLADLWSPDFGPPPEDMPAEIRWMHGRLWCPGERPPRVMADGSSECDHALVPTDPALQSAGPITEEARGCTVWPSRRSDLSYSAPWGDPEVWLTCSPDYSVCCAGQIDLPPPCGWFTLAYAAAGWSGDPATPAATAWAEANGLQLINPVNHPSLPDALEAAFPNALNNCHPICKPPACGP